MNLSEFEIFNVNVKKLIYNKVELDLKTVFLNLGVEIYGPKICKSHHEKFYSLQSSTILLQISEIYDEHFIIYY